MTDKREWPRGKVLSFDPSKSTPPQFGEEDEVPPIRQHLVSDLALAVIICIFAWIAVIYDVETQAPLFAKGMDIVMGLFGFWLAWRTANRRNI